MNRELSWLSAQKYCQQTYNGNLASRGLEKFAARKKLFLDYNLKRGIAVGFRRVSGKWLRTDGSAVEPALDFRWYPGHPYNNNYMYVNAYKSDYSDSVGLLWDSVEATKRAFFCEN